MFYCDMCAFERGYPEGFRKSRGPCEFCGKTRNCSDVPTPILTKYDERKKADIGSEVAEQWKC